MTLKHRMPIVVRDSYYTEGSATYRCEGCGRELSPKRTVARWFIRRETDEGWHEVAYHTHDNDACVGSFFRKLAGMNKFEEV